MVTFVEKAHKPRSEYRLQATGTSVNNASVYTEPGICQHSPESTQSHISLRGFTDTQLLKGIFYITTDTKTDVNVNIHLFFRYIFLISAYT